MFVICGRDRPIRVAKLVLGDAEVSQQLLVGGGLFQRVELGAVQVLQQGVAEHVDICGVADDRRNGVKPDSLASRAGGAPP